MQSILDQLKADFPNYTFQPSKTFLWSPTDEIIHYRADQLNIAEASWSLLHEVSHAQLGHQTYQSDFELLLMEIEAWEAAKKLAAKYNIVINNDHIEDCIDTYRDWLYQRSTCPLCTSSGVQLDHRTYNCVNCASSWNVSASRLCRTYRRQNKKTYR